MEWVKATVSDFTGTFSGFYLSATTPMFFLISEHVWCDVLLCSCFFFSYVFLYTGLSWKSVSIKSLTTTTTTVCLLLGVHIPASHHCSLWDFSQYQLTEAENLHRASTRKKFKCCWSQGTEKNWIRDKLHEEIDTSKALILHVYTGSQRICIGDSKVPTGSTNVSHSCSWRQTALNVSSLMCTVQFTKQPAEGSRS